VSIWKNFNKEESQENSSMYDLDKTEDSLLKPSSETTTKSKFYPKSTSISTTTTASKSKQLLKLIRQEIPNFSGFMYDVLCQPLIKKFLEI